MRHCGGSSEGMRIARLSGDCTAYPGVDSAGMDNIEVLVRVRIQLCVEQLEASAARVVNAEQTCIDRVDNGGGIAGRREG